jgi:tripartite-type tricarboxylate transporter receptor subunit TctC
MKMAVCNALAALTAALAGTASVHAQYPTRTIRFIVPFAAGSGNDTVARLVQPQLSAALGQQVVIDNRPGAALQLSAKMLDSMAGIQTTEVNYKGTPQAITAVISGETSIGFPATSSAMPYARSGKLRALAVTTPKRSHMAPEVPTLSESGVPGYDVTTWYGVLVPAATPGEIIARLNGAAVNALTHPAVKERFAQTDLEPIYSTPEQFGAYIRGEVAKWAKVIKESGFRIE